MGNTSRVCGTCRHYPELITWIKFKQPLRCRLMPTDATDAVYTKTCLPVPQNSCSGTVRQALPPHSLNSLCGQPCPAWRWTLWSYRMTANSAPETILSTLTQQPANITGSPHTPNCQIHSASLDNLINRYNPQNLRNITGNLATTSVTLANH